MKLLYNLRCWRCKSPIQGVGDFGWSCKWCGRNGELPAELSRFNGWRHNAPYMLAVLRGDWGWVFVNRRGKVIGFKRYTFRHRLRLLIGIVGVFGSGEYVFNRIKFRRRLHYFLDWLLTSKRLQRSRTLLKNRRP